jgi:hypothetical protein
VAERPLLGLEIARGEIYERDLAAYDPYED